MNEKYEIIPVSSEETELLYSTNNPVRDAEIGCIGRLRADFGRNGDEFWSTWLDFCREIKTKAFSDELDDLINSLREGGILESRDAMAAYCAANLQVKISDTRFDSYGFKIKTDNYIYYLRCIPIQGDYNLYCHAYERSRFEKYFPY